MWAITSVGTIRSSTEKRMTRTLITIPVQARKETNPVAFKPNPNLSSFMKL